MLLLRLSQDAIGDRYQIEITLGGNGALRTARADVKFRLRLQDLEDLRWYLEDYLQWPHAPAPKIAARVEMRMVELGTGLFRAIFEANRQARRIWYVVAEALSSVRVEVVTTVEEANLIPCELLREPGAEAPMALLTHSFVRARLGGRRTLPEAIDPAVPKWPVRILLVICRPDRRHDVPFRSVATRILKGLGETVRGCCRRASVCRPRPRRSPT